MSPEIEMRHLRYFIAVAEELHFGRAADRLHMAQPPLSQQIRKLEALIGAPLLTRTSRSVALTPAGEAFLIRSRRLISQSQADVEEAARIGRGEGGRLDLGFVSSALILGVVDRIHAFGRRYTDVDMHLHENFTSELIDRVAHRDIDLAFVRDADTHALLTTSTLVTEHFVAVVPADHHSAAQSSIAASSLRDDPFVFYPRAAGELAVRRNLKPCHDAGYEPRVVQQASNWTTIFHLVGAGMGVTIAPASATATAPDNVRAIPLRNSSSTSEIQLITRADDKRPLLQNFKSL